MEIAAAIFWASFGFVAYTYALYPAGIWILSRFRPAEAADPASVTNWPSVTICVAVYNEQHRVPAKIKNLRELDYPRDRLRFLFVSDGSTDGTNDILAREKDIELVAYPERHGKPYALNRALERVESEIVVFTDVRQTVEPKAVRYLVARLLSPGIGAVSGELKHHDPATQSAAHIGLYWRYEKAIRKAESRLASTVGVTGALYAIRRVDYVPLHDDTLLDDLEIPMQIARRGKRVVFESRALVHDELQVDAVGERKRKVRTLTGNFQAFARHPWMLSPFHNPLFVQLMSHKVFRLFVPYALAAFLASSLLAAGVIYTAAAVAQTMFYVGAAAGVFAPAIRRNRLASFAVVFVELNWAAVLAMVNFARGRFNARWEKT